VQVGSREALLDDARRLVERARAAGVDAGLMELAGVVHMWIVFGPDIPESLAAFQSAARFPHPHAAPSPRS
jgi:acetyl esterase/lipase